MGTLGDGTLGDFLRTRRGRLRPADAGITSYGARRVPGLRREELARLAGVSVTYYTRLEQGQSHQASWSVVEALADALRLSPDERAYLHRLARPEPVRRSAGKPATARAGTRQLLAALTDVPAVVVGVRTEVLAWNALGHRLLAGHVDFDAPDRPVDRPNLTRMLFLDAHYAGLHPDWPVTASCAVASLRITAARSPDDVGLAELIGELTMKSAAFASLWASHPVANHAYGSRRIHHPEVGELELELETAGLPDGHHLIMYSARPDSPSDTALHLLKLTTPTAPARVTT